MNCADYKNLLVPFLEGLLAEPHKQAVNSHLKACSTCRAELKELIALHNRLVKNGKALAQTNLETGVMNQIVRIQNARLKVAATASTEGPAVRRHIMRSPIMKLAAAAVIVVGVLFGLRMIGPSNVVIAEVLEKIEQIKTFTYRMRLNMDMPAAPQGQIKDLKVRVLVSQYLGIRMDTTLENKLISRTCIVPGEQAIYSIMPNEKKYMRINFTQEIFEKMQKDNGDPRAWLKEAMKSEYTQLGQSIIDGVEVKGVESRGANVVEGMLGDAVQRLWVDARTDLPVKLEIEVFSKQGRKIMDMLISDFEWNADIPDAELTLDIPEDYQMLAEVDLSGDEQNIVKGLRFFAELTGGRYPTELSPMKMASELQEALLPALSTRPNQEPSKEDVQSILNLQMAGPMFAALRNEGKDPAYYGDIVTAEFPHAVLMRWKNDDGTYLVILGDLSVKQVDAEQLKKLEAAPLNPRPTAVKPHPANGAEGTVLAGLKLTWIPGAYATAHRVYFGTDPAQLTLLGEITTEQAEPGTLQRSTSYYWRIDEVQADGSIAAGEIWSFNTGRLVAHWKLDDGAGRTASDATGNGCGGKLIGDPAWTTGKAGGALAFDGNEDYIEVTDGNDLNIVNQITVAAWIKVNVFDKEWQAIVTKGDHAWRLQRNWGKGTLEFACTGVLVPGNKQGSLFGTVDVNDGRWHHVAGVYDGQVMSLYVDGVHDVSTKAAGKIYKSDQAVLIGENSEKPGRCWNGLIDDLRIYSYGLTAEEVAALCQR